MAPRDRIANYTTYGIYKNTVTTAAFSGAYFPFIDDITSKEFVSIAMIIVNDSANDIEFSFDGATVHGVIKTSETLSIDRRREQEIWFRSGAPAGDAFRFWAW